VLMGSAARCRIYEVISGLSVYFIFVLLGGGDLGGFGLVGFFVILLQS